jgi:hypothetical protein
MENKLDPSKITKFYFDTNIYSHIFVGHEGREYLDIILSRQSSTEIMVHFTVVNLVELLQEWSEERFLDVRTKLQDASKIVAGGNILEEPSSHVQRPVRRYLGLSESPLQKEWVNVPRLLSRATSWNEAESIVKPIKDHVGRFKENWVESMNEMIKNVNSVASCLISKGNYLNAEDVYDCPEFIAYLRQDMWKACIRHFRLPDNSSSIVPQHAAELFHSFRYWMEFFYNYYRKVIVKNRKHQASDYFDIEQSIYLNIMDYWVSDDPRARRCMKNCRDSSGDPRCISLRTFYNYLTNKIPPPCAPEQASMVRYRTQNQI